MTNQVCAGALLRCTMGSAPCMLQVTRPDAIHVNGQKAANIQDHKADNILTFGSCSAFLPAKPCKPSIATPWQPGAAVTKVANQPALTDSSICLCTQGGMISVESSGQSISNTL